MKEMSFFLSTFATLLPMASFLPGSHPGYFVVVVVVVVVFVVVAVTVVVVDDDDVVAVVVFVAFVPNSNCFLFLPHVAILF